MEIAVLSGKGGTGKTTIVAALSELIGSGLKVDCDVDAPNLYLFYKGEEIDKREFFGGKKARIDKSLCLGCGLCEEVCKFNAIKDIKIDKLLCEGCGACTVVCPRGAIVLYDEKTADTFITKTSKGIISRAKMGIGSDGSGRLITELRKNARAYAKEGQITLLDGSPGIGCSVIASITNTDYALIVTEPTKSGLDDLKRIVSLAGYFDSKLMICINKYDINLNMTKSIEEYAKTENIKVVGKIPFDKKVMESVNSLKPITYFNDSIAKNAIEEMYKRIMEEIL